MHQNLVLGYLSISLYFDSKYMPIAQLPIAHAQYLAHCSLPIIHAQYLANYSNPLLARLR